MNSLTDQNNSGCDACEFDENLSLLRGMEAFAALPLEAQRAYAYMCERVRYQTGDDVFTQDATDDKAYLVISGSLQILRDTGEGESGCGLYKAGDFIGGMALLADIRRLFTLRALEPSVCLIMPRKKMLTDHINNPETSMRFMRAIANRIVAWEERLLQSGVCADTERHAGISLI